MPRIASHSPALVICAFFVMLALVYSASTPPFEAPDEGSHFLYIHNLLESGALPVLEDRDTVFASQSTQRHHPPLYYLAGAVLVSWTQRGDVSAYLERNPLASIGFVAENNQNVYLHQWPPPEGDTGIAIGLLRLFSIALAAGTVWFVYRAGTLAADDRYIGLLAAGLTVSLPSFIHISASINNDNLVTFLFAAGVYSCLRIWQRQEITHMDMLVLSLILAGVALAKTNGLALFAVVYGTMLLGAIKGRFSARRALSVVAVSLLAAALLAGWWYMRNMQLYGDPLGLTATLRIWARGGPPQLISWFEAKGVWESFWFILGHFNIRGPEWLFVFYLPLVMLLACAGIVVAFIRRAELRWRLVFLWGVGLLTVLALLAASSRINVSQGRILFPGLVAFAPLVVLGWMMLLGRRLAGLLILPLLVLALIAPVVYLYPAYAGAQIMTTVPDPARRIDAYTDDLALLAYELHGDPVRPGDWLRLTLYIRGAHPENPLLFVKALDPLTQEVVGGLDVYPAMLPTDSLMHDQIYAVPVRFRVGDHSGLLRLKLALGWRVPEADDPGEGDFLPLVDANGVPVNTLLVDGPTLLNPAPLVETPQYPADILYGEAIRLVGTTLSTERLRPGEALSVTTFWNAVRAIPDDWTLSLGLLAADGRLEAQADGMPPGYPTSAWVPGTAFTDTRTLLLPENTLPGVYRLYSAWYNPLDSQRLRPTGTGADPNAHLYLHPALILVE